ncbi:FAD-dependent oxidoreductase [Caminibacter pacificus]
MKVAVIGGGVTGSSIAMYLDNLGVDVTLFEKNDLVSGPPICHLHAGGNLYREITLKEKIALLKESIDFIRLYPQAIDFRPTIVAVPVDDEGEPEDLIETLEILKNEYKKMIEKDPKNKVLGEPEDYYKLYYKKDLEKLKEKELVKEPKTLDEWMIPFAKYTNLNKIKYPVILVQEYGVNVFRLSAISKMILEKKGIVRYEEAKVSKKGDKWIVNGEEFDYLINAAGFKSGIVDDALEFKRDRLTEFKAAYVVKNKKFDFTWPEIIFHGKRGTPKGMAQFTPYANGIFQLHGMTKDITLFDDGLVSSDEESSYPKLPNHFIEKIEKGWQKEEAASRAKRAIKHMSKFIPEFKDSEVTYVPLFGAQQIPGRDAELRAVEISFEENYARCEVVKASTVTSMADSIAKDLSKRFGIKYKKQIEIPEILSLSDEAITKKACEIAKSRGYPEDMGKRNFSELKS